MSTGTTKLDVVVSDIVPVNEIIKRFHFRRADGAPLPTFSGGAHVVVEMRDGETSRLNPYSLMSSPLDTSEYTISVRRDDVGRGGSLFMHGKVEPGHRMVISYPVNLFSLDLRAKKHLMLAGGIGITPFLAQTAQLAGRGRQFRTALRLPHGGPRRLCRCAWPSAMAGVSISIMTTGARRFHSTGCSRHSRWARISTSVDRPA